MGNMAALQEVDTAGASGIAPACTVGHRDGVSFFCREVAYINCLTIGASRRSIVNVNGTLICQDYSSCVSLPTTTPCLVCLVLCHQKCHADL